MITILLTTTLYKFLTFLPALCIILFVVGLVALLRYAKIRENRFRATIPPICSWEYSAVDWQKFAKLYELAKLPKGVAKVRITLLDIWITDDNRTRQNILDAERKCVTGCRIIGEMFTVRVRSWAIPMKKSIVYTCEDFSLPIPIGKENEVFKLVELFKKNIVEKSKKIASVIPDDVLMGIDGEVGF